MLAVKTMAAKKSSISKSDNLEKMGEFWDKHDFSEFDDPNAPDLQTDLARLDRMKDEDIDYSDAPEITPEMFAKAIVRRGLKPRVKKQITLRVDDDVLSWFKKQGTGYQTKINLLLRAYMEEHVR